MTTKRFDDLPDVRDGLTRKERIVLYCLLEAQKERPGRNVPTAMLYDRVVEYVDMTVDELQKKNCSDCQVTTHRALRLKQATE